MLGHKGRVMCVAVGPDGKTAASGGDDLTIRLWDVASGKERGTIKVGGEAGWIGSLDFSPDGKTLAAGGSGAGANTVMLWDVRTGRGVTVLEEGQCMHPVARFGPDGKTLATAATFLNETPVTFWDAATRERVAKAEKSLGVQALAFDPDGTTAVVLGRRGGITRVQATTGRVTATTGTADTSFSAAVFSPGAKSLATATWDEAAVRVWSVATGKEQVAIRGPAGRVYCMAFSPDGRTLATGSSKGALKLWDAATGEEVATLAGHDDEVRSLAFSADGKLIVSGSSDGEVKLWDVPPQK